MDSLANDIEATPDRLRSTYNDENLLRTCIEKTVYYNINPISNENKEQDFNKIATSGSSHVGALTWTELLSLDADVILISGKAGLIAFNTASKITPPIGFKQSSRLTNGTIVQSIAHPSRPDYTEWCRIINGLRTLYRNS
jgi:hypothetical protein